MPHRPGGSAEEVPRPDEHEEDSGPDPPGSDVEPRGADAQRPAQVTPGVGFIKLTYAQFEARNVRTQLFMPRL